MPSTTVSVSTVGAEMYCCGLYLQRDDFPHHTKFPEISLTFPVEASKDYPVSNVYPYGQQLLFHINEKQGEAR